MMIVRSFGQLRRDSLIKFIKFMICVEESKLRSMSLLNGILKLNWQYDYVGSMRGGLYRFREVIWHSHVSIDIKYGKGVLELEMAAIKSHIVRLFTYLHVCISILSKEMYDNLDQILSLEPTLPNLRVRLLSCLF